MRVPVPIVVAPSLRVKVPVGLVPVTVAFNVVACPAVAGFGVAVTVVLLTAVLTVNAAAVEVLAALLVSPAYSAVMLCAPVLLKV